MAERTRITARFSISAPQLEGRTWEDVRHQIQAWIEHATSIFDGLGTKAEEGGFSGFSALVVPEPIEAGDVGNIGSAGSGFAHADHEHPVTTSGPSGLANAPVTGTSIALSRADHQHKRDVRVKAAGVDVATKNAIDFRDSSTVTFTIAADNPNDEVDVSVALAGGLATSIDSLLAHIDDGVRWSWLIGD